MAKFSIKIYFLKINMQKKKDIIHIDEIIII